MRIGVLALQGGFAPHLEALSSVGHRTSSVRYADDLLGLDGLVLPGGESTTQLKLLEAADLIGPLERFVAAGRPVLATCAGVILAARKVEAVVQRSMSWLDIGVARNAWGRQLDSFEAVSDDLALPLVFIRAPRIDEVGEAVEVLETLDGEPILVRQGNIVGATFHPELTRDPTVASIAFGEQRRADSGASWRDCR